MREYDDSWLQPLRDHTEQIRRKTEAIRQETEELRRQGETLRRDLAAKRARRKVLQDRLHEKAVCDAARYRWLKSRAGLDLRTCEMWMKWTREDGTTFYQSHQLAEAGTSHAAYETLDETIDAAMIVAQERDKERL